jgi:hypothetical protein
MIKQLLGCIIGVPGIPKGTVWAMCTLLDFVYLAQYPIHTTTTLNHLEHALQEFHQHKEVFLNLSAREGVFLFSLSQVCARLVIYAL